MKNWYCGDHVSIRQPVFMNRMSNSTTVYYNDAMCVLLKKQGLPESTSVLQKNEKR